MNLSKILTFIIFVFLAGCNERLNYSYAELMQHPLRLKKAVEICQSSSLGDSEECDTVEQANKDFKDLLYKQQNNPERFGQDLMDEELACVKEAALVQERGKDVQQEQVKEVGNDEGKEQGKDKGKEQVKDAGNDEGKEQGKDKGEEQGKVARIEGANSKNSTNFKACQNVNVMLAVIGESPPE